MHSIQRVFITGASSGIGEGLARHYAAPGVQLGLVARRAQRLESLAGELQQCGANVQTFAQDVADTAGMASVVERYLQQAGGADLVIANAGVGLRYGQLEQSAEQVVSLLRINVHGVVNTILPFIPCMLRQRGGVLAAVSSVAGLRALPWCSAYCASKSAVRTFMDGRRMELRGTGVHVMTLCPGFVDTELLDETAKRLFTIDVPTAVRHIVRAITRRRKTAVFPWHWRLLNPIWTRLPEALLVRVIPRPPGAQSR